MFKPTFLYIKRHTVTNKFYFGKTIKDPIKYYGSGGYWSKHIKIHDKKYIETLWYCLFYDQKSISDFALSFCELHKIGYGDISSWANLTPENGLFGGSNFTGKHHTNESKSKISNGVKGKGMFGKKHTEESKIKISMSNKGKSRGKGRTLSKEHIIKLSKSAKLRTHTIETKLKMSKSQTKEKNGFWNKIHSNETKLKMSNSWANRKIEKCPHCCFSSQNIGMLKRWHFDNCKFK